MDSKDSQPPGLTPGGAVETGERHSLSALDAMKAYYSSGEMPAVAPPPPCEGAAPPPSPAGFPFPSTPVPPPLMPGTCFQARPAEVNLAVDSDIYNPEDSFALPSGPPFLPVASPTLASIGKKKGPAIKRLKKLAPPKTPRVPRANAKAKASSLLELPPPADGRLE